MSVLAGVLLTAGAVLIAFGLVGLLVNLARWLEDRVGPVGMPAVVALSGLIVLALAFAAGAAR